MTFDDFEYDGRNLSDFGYILCNFNNSKGFNNVSLGSVLTLNKITTNQGKKYLLASSQYDECIEGSFQICKNPCGIKDLTFTTEELRQLMRWLNRREFLPLVIISDDFQNLHFEATFNIEKIMLGDDVYGLELQFFTNSPFAHGDIQYYNFNSSEEPNYSIFDISDEIGDIDLNVELTTLSSGDLIITNKFDDSQTIIRNCSANENIKLSNMMIESNMESEHEIGIMNDFNWEFPKIKNTFSERLNIYDFSIPCEVTMSYEPIIKVGV